MDHYICDCCGKRFDELEMNFKAAQEDKRTLCQECRAKQGIPRKVLEDTVK